MKDNDREEITAVVERLRSFHISDRQENLGCAFLRRIEDPIRPKADRGSLHVNPMLLLLALIALLTGGTFLFFSLVHL
jgi:hypothetical protein